MLNIVGAAVATEPELPPIAAAGYEYVVAANGVFIRAENRLAKACVLVRGFDEPVRGLNSLAPYAFFTRVPRIPASLLWSVIVNARDRMPNEAMYQFKREAKTAAGDSTIWICICPRQTATRVNVDFVDDPGSLVDIHSHNSMSAFFSEQDNADEQGFRFYCVLGKLDTDTPEIICRVGVYGYFMKVPMTTIFSDSVAAPIIDLYNHDNR